MSWEQLVGSYTSCPIKIKLSIGARFQLRSLTNMLTQWGKSENIGLLDRRLSHYKSVHGWGSEVRALLDTFASIGDRQHNYGPLAISTAPSAALKRPVKVCTCSLRCSHVSRVLTIKIENSRHIIPPPLQVNQENLSHCVMTGYTVKWSKWCKMMPFLKCVSCSWMAVMVHQHIIWNNEGFVHH